LLQYSNKIDWFYNLEKEGNHIKALDEKPKLYEDLESVFEAFKILSSTRPVGMSIGAIPLTEISAYMKMFGIDGYQEKKRFLKQIQILDAVYLKHSAKQSNKKAAKPEVKKKNG